MSCYTPKSTTHRYRVSQGGSGGAWPLIELQVLPGEVRRGLKNTQFRQLAEKNLDNERTDDCL